MKLDRILADAFRMDDATWARHANPWSVWTRLTCLPLIVLALWSRAWIGTWALVPFALAVLWTWLNPRIFPRPASTGNWASKAVLGERIWLARARVPIPEHHATMARILSIVAGIGAVLILWGVVALAPWPTAIGFTLVYAGKLWFLDRMVWLYEDMHDARDEYGRWLY